MQIAMTPNVFLVVFLKYWIIKWICIFKLLNICGKWLLLMKNIVCNESHTFISVPLYVLYLLYFIDNCCLIFLRSFPMSLYIVNSISGSDENLDPSSIGTVIAHTSNVTGIHQWHCFVMHYFLIIYVWFFIILWMIRSTVLQLKMYYSSILLTWG